MGSENLEKRIIEVDILRGIAVIMMIFDHIMYDIWGLMREIFPDFPQYGGVSSTICRIAVDYWKWDIRIVVRCIFLAFFLGLTGICCSFSKSNLKRGLKLMAVSLALTAGTYLIGEFIGDPDIMITFGVLHCMALALIVIGLAEKVISNKWFYLAVGIIMIVLGIIIGKDAPYVHYKDGSMVSLVIGQILGTCLCGGDCFPFLLYGGQVFVGVFLGKLLYKVKKSLFKKAHYSNNPVTFVGRNSLAVYFAHQIIIPLIMGIILLLCGFSIAL